ncbi:major facilitator superfamily domain-containing protein [Clohesyomyces aquaticus]|uniref:Major facilitator superfamily domain-containing protein n=1 Tax=Clohesyomyces aquaticus TaxID=1231657 RepID=A0A1Y1ZPG2_9PLEO|nr:major facilitator superfamily domain-containing protein [Clohesyomyces aquaticus]
MTPQSSSSQVDEANRSETEKSVTPGSERDTPSLPRIDPRKPNSTDLPGRDEYLVEFDGPEDPANPQNWPTRTKVLIIAILSTTTFATTLASGIYSPAITTIANRYAVGPEVATLGVTLYVLGFAAGPILWGPLSEVKGRRLPLVVAAFGTAIFHFATAVSKDIQSILINRFFAGFFGTSPLAVAGGVFVDLFDNTTRGFAVTVFTLCVFIGPMVAPFLGGFIVTSHLGWRWTMHLSGILASAAAVLNLMFVYESYAPIILAQKAAKLRRETKNWAIHAKIEETEVDIRVLVGRTIYSAFIYGLLYLFLTAYPKIFQGVYGMSPGVGGLPELGPVLGCVITGIVMILRQPVYVRKLESNKNLPVPEWRMLEAMYGAVLFAGGLFWLGWSGYRKEVHWIVPTIGGVVAGHGISLVFLQTFNYLIDSYLMLAASAIAANTFLRSLFGAISPLFASYMFDGMGIQWALTLLGCFASLLAPVPIIFYFKGAYIRKVSKYAPKLNLKPVTDRKTEEV